MASPKKPSLEENKISESGWTMPQDVVGELPAQRPEVHADVLTVVEAAWAGSAARWVGDRIAIRTPEGWDTGQGTLFGGITRLTGSWPKQCRLSNGEVCEVRPWVPRPMDKPIVPTPVSYDATPGGPGNHYKGLGHQAKHGEGPQFATPKARMSSGDLIHGLSFSHDEARPSYAEAAKIFADGGHGLWRTPSARDYKGADPNNATGRQIGLNDQVKKHGNAYRGDGKLFATPQHHDGTTGNPERVGRFGTLVGGRNLNDEAMAFPHKGGILPTPTGTERAGTNPNTGKGGGLSRHVKDEAGISAVPRADKPVLFPTPSGAEGSQAVPEGTSITGKRPDGSKATVGLGARVKQFEDDGRPKVKPDKNYPTPVASDQFPRRKTENWSGTSDLPSVVTTLEEAGGAVVPRAGGQLNPDWVDLLMGYPLGTTQLAPEAEAWFAIDARRLKASDLKKLHAMDAHDEEESTEEANDGEEAKQK